MEFKSSNLGFLCSMIFRTVFVMALVSRICGMDNAGQLARIVNELQSQVVALQEARHQDKETIKALETKLHQHFGVQQSFSDYNDDSSVVETKNNLIDSVNNNGKPFVTPLPIITSSPKSFDSDRGLARVFTTVIDPKNLPSKDFEFSEKENNKDLLKEKLHSESRAIRLLEHERRSLSRLDSQLQELKSNLAEVVKIKEKEVDVTENIADFRLEADSLREEVLKVRREVAELRSKREEDLAAVRRAKTEQVTTQWLLKTIEELRHEMGEIASAVNVSAALKQKQNAETNLDLTRSDLIDLRKKLDAAHVAQERDSAWILQLREDLSELRQNLQDLATKHQNLVHEVSAVKEELIEARRVSRSEKYKRSLTDGSTKEDRHSRQKLDGSSHRMRHHSHCKEEIEELQKNFNNLQFHQNELIYQIHELKQNQSELNLKANILDSASVKLVNKSAHLGVEQRALMKQMEVLQNHMEETNYQTNNLWSTVNNITESGIKKLHASTVQLFETLESVENNYAHTIESIQKEMSKLEFNLAQAQSTVSELQEEQTDHEQMMKSMKNDIKKIQMDSKKDHLKLLSVQSDVINRTLQDSKSHNFEAIKELKISELESKIVSLSKAVDGEKMEVDALHKQIEEKADTSSLSVWERTQDRLREIVLNMTTLLPQMQRDEQNLEKELEKFVNQLPIDCSMGMDSEQSSKYKSGSYLIQYPLPTSTSTVHPRSIRVYCDMDTAGGMWTVLQRRQDGKQDFNQNWHQYKQGFGNVEGDFWLGNDIIHYLTTSGDYVLRIDLWDSAGRYKYVEYDTFRVLQESDGFRLAIAGYHGNASDALEYHNGMAFSTPDRDNDASPSTHCGQFYGSGWWYNHCQYVNINGRYNTGVTWYDIDGQEWSELTKVEMKIKPLRLTKRLQRNEKIKK